MKLIINGEKMKTYSIIIPHRNNTNGLERLLNSIYQPDNKEDVFLLFIENLEVLIIDDNSDEEYQEKLTEIVKKYSVVFIKNESGIQSAGLCRNLGLERAKNYYIIFSDSDDFFTNNYYQLLIKNEKVDTDILFFAPKSVYDDNINKPSDRHVVYDALINQYLNDKSNEAKLRYIWLGPWSKRYSNSFLKNNKIKFDETIVSNDVMFSVKAGHMARDINATKDCIYILTRRQGSLVYSISEKNLRCRVVVGFKYKCYCDNVGFTDYQDHYIRWITRGVWLGPMVFLRLIKYSKKIGVFDDKKYVMKFLMLSVWHCVVFLFNNFCGTKRFFYVKND